MNERDEMEMTDFKDNNGRRNGFGFIFRAAITII